MTRTTKPKPATLPPFAAPAIPPADGHREQPLRRDLCRYRALNDAIAPEFPEFTRFGATPAMG